MGEVWRARSLRLDREVAVKRVSTDIPDAHDRLVHEAKAIARLRHPSIVQVFDVVYDEHEAPYLVMELLEGTDLGHLLNEHGPLPQVRAVALILQVIHGLQAAHAHGVIHRDVKPDNIMLTLDDHGRERPVLLDFGISQIAWDRESRGPVAGTPDFMAPEQFTGMAVGAEADQWSTCVTLYSLVAGRSPFHRKSLEALFEAIAAAPLPYPREAEMDPSLFAILARGTRKAPEDRYPNLDELQDALETWLNRQAPRRTRYP